MTLVFVFYITDQMDNNWMYLPRVNIEYEKGLDKFLDSMFSKECLGGQILCPCIKCGNEVWVDREEARIHLICDGFIKGYQISPSISQHSNTPASGKLDDMQGLVYDAFYMLDENMPSNEIGIEDENFDIPNAHVGKFYKVLEDAKKELYPGCNQFSVLSFIVRLYHSKCLGKCNDQGFTMMLDTLREAFPDACIPKSLYEMKKIIRDLGLTYEKIDACPNDCMLYWKENNMKNECDVCHTSRFTQDEDDHEDQLTETLNPKKIAAKVLRYFPLKPRL